jgi:hypothetical protein
VEDVHDEVTEIEQNPSALGTTLATDRLDSVLDHLVFDFARDGDDVALVAARREKEDIGKRQGSGNVESDEVFTLLRVGGSNCYFEQFTGVGSSGHWVLVVLERKIEIGMGQPMPLMM